VGIEILLLTRDQQTARSVEQAAHSSGGMVSRITPFTDSRELAARLDREPAPLALVDLGPQPLLALPGLEPLIRKFPGTRFVIVCAELQTELLLEAMQVGARTCLPQSEIATELASVVRRLLQELPAPAASAMGPLGKIVTVLSASGGCGGTTVAVNLAEELRLETDRPALVVDLDQHYGSVSAYLGVNGHYGVADILSHVGAIDSQLVRSTALGHSDKLHVLISPASVNFTEPAALSWERLEQLLGACKQTYGYTVIDAPRVPSAVAARLAVESAMTLVVFELVVVDIRCARDVLGALAERGVASDSVLPIANRYRKRNPMLSFEDAQKALGGRDLAHVTNDYESAMRSLNLGKLLAGVAPRSPMRKDLRDLALRVEAQSKSSLVLRPEGSHGRS